MAEALEFRVTAENRIKVGYTGALDEVLNIPATFIDNEDSQEYKVVSIEASAFQGCAEIKSVVLPENVTSIGESAFNGCTKLASVALPNTLTSVGANAFANTNETYTVSYNGTSEQWTAVTVDPSANIPTKESGRFDATQDLEKVIYEFLNREGVSQLAKALLTKVNTRIEERIVQEVTIDSDENHLASAKAVYNVIQKMTHLQFKTHIGPIEEVVDPQTNYIYLQRDNTEDRTWTMYVYNEVDGWIAIGDTTVNLGNYWSKDPEDIEALKLALGLTQDFDQLTTKVAQLESDVSQLKSDVNNVTSVVEGKVDPDQLVALSEEVISSAVDAAFTETSPSI